MTEARCLSVSPIMPTTDMARTEVFYAALGFETHRNGDEFLTAKRDGIELFFGLNLEHDPKRTASCIYIRVTDSDALHQLWAGIAGVKELKDQDYKMRDLPVIDPDNNMLLFGSPLPDWKP